MRIEFVPLHRDIGMHTRYTAVNVVLLVLGALVTIFDFVWIGVILGHVHGPDRGWMRVGIDSLALIAALAVLSTLIAWRWPKAASTALWTLTFLFFVDIVAVHLFLQMLIPAILLAAASALASLIEHFSAKARKLQNEEPRA